MKRQLGRRVFRSVLLAFRWSLFLLGLSVFLAVICGVPRGLYRWLSVGGASVPESVDYIVVLGGGGIPSGSGLMRTYCGAEAAGLYTNAKCIVSLPTDIDIEDSNVGRMRDELVMRGVRRERVLIESRAHDTFQQSIEIKHMLGEGFEKTHLLIVTSPSHLRRSKMCFDAQGFENVYVSAAREVGADADMGTTKTLKFFLWCNAADWIKVSRELCALGYYKVLGRL